jgi:hypothetical protein
MNQNIINLNLNYLMSGQKNNHDKTGSHLKQTSLEEKWFPTIGRLKKSIFVFFSILFSL